MSRTYLLRAAVIVFAVPLVLAGCSSQDDHHTAPSRPSNETTSLQTATLTANPDLPPPIGTGRASTQRPPAPNCKPDEVSLRCWNTAPDQEGAQQTRPDIGPIFNISPSRSADYDTVVVNVETLGDVPFDARYWSPTSSQPELLYPSGQPVGLQGTVLLVKVYALLGPDAGKTGFFWEPGGNGIRRAAIIESFEGQTVFAFETGKQVPFAVMRDHGSSSATEVIVYVAH